LEGFGVDAVAILAKLVFVAEGFFDERGALAVAHGGPGLFFVISEAEVFHGCLQSG
jgi:hypothetical protein